MTFEHLNAVRKMKDIIGELKELNKEMDTLLEIKDEDLDSYEFLTDDELDDLLDDDYKEAMKGDE